MSTSAALSKIEELMCYVSNYTDSMKQTHSNDDSKDETSNTTDFNIRGYLAVVTGAADGIGKGICHKFAKEGCNLALVDINGTKLNEVVNKLKSLHPTLNIAGFECDLSNKKQVYELVNKIQNTFNTNTIQILFNNAGIYYTELLDGDIEKLRKTMDINFWSMIYTTKAFKSMLIKNEISKQCFIINTGSMASLMTANTMYAVTKHAIIAFSETIAIEFNKNYPNSNIFVSTLTPLYVETNLAKNSNKQLKDNSTDATWSDDGFIKLYKSTVINIDECAEIVYKSMKEKLTVISTNKEYFEAAIKDRMNGLLNCKPNEWNNWHKLTEKLK